MTGLSAAILSVLVSLPPSHTDLHEPADARRERLTIVALAINDATLWATCRGRYATEQCVPSWRGQRKELAAALLSIGWFESRWAGYVGRDDCLAGPVGSRCDLDRRTGLPRARQYWQTWDVACRPLESIPPGDPRAVYASARCTARLWTAAYRRCATEGVERLTGAFSGHAGGASCERPSALARIVTYRRLLLALERAARSPAPLPPQDPVAIQADAR